MTLIALVHTGTLFLPQFVWHLVFHWSLPQCPTPKSVVLAADIASQLGRIPSPVGLVGDWTEGPYGGTVGSNPHWQPIWHSVLWGLRSQELQEE